MICSLQKQQKLINNIESQKKKYFHKKQKLEMHSTDCSNSSSASSSPQLLKEDSNQSLLQAKRKLIRKPQKFQLKNKIIAEGHRGAGIHMVENTLPCFRRGIEIGLNSVELDVWLTSDKQIVVVHGKDDDTIQLDDGSFKKINEMKFQEITEKYTIKGEKCPLLRDVLLTCKDKVHVNIEIKGRENEMCEQILNLVIQCGMVSQVHFSSFLHYHQPLLIQALQSHNLPTNSIQFGYLIWEHKDFDTFDQINFQGNILAFPCNFVYDEVALPFIFKAQERGMRLSTYFDFDVIENFNIYKRLYDIGVDCIITNQPQLLVNFLKKFQKQN
ncbi:hypothetical protein ABPG74_000929 [Tetrahymena malaccensis]